MLKMCTEEEKIELNRKTLHNYSKMSERKHRESGSMMRCDVMNVAKTNAQLAK